MNLAEVHINCDLGEGAPHQSAIMNYIQACNIACGGHYGTAQTIYDTLSEAIDHKLDLGAHPSYPDLENFGRSSLKMSSEEFISSIRRQLDTYFDQLSKFNTSNHHIKAHGALYNDLLDNSEYCEWFLEAIQDYPFKVVFTPFNGQLAMLAKKRSIPIAYEAFIDRNYTDQGRLVPRSQPNAEKNTLSEVWDQLHLITTTNTLITASGTSIEMKADTFCIHGDHPQALERVHYLHQKLN